MGTKLVIGADGSQSYVNTTLDDDAQAAIDAQAASASAVASQMEAARIAGIKGDARQVFLMNALTTLSNTAINNGIAARYPSLTGDQLKFAQDVALVLAALAKH